MFSFSIFSNPVESSKVCSNQRMRTFAATPLKVDQQPSLFSASRASSRRLPFFIRCGNKEKLESHFRRLVIKREGANRTVLIKGGVERIQPSIADLFEPLFISATPFIALKALRSRRKRRGKRIINKLLPLDRARSERKPFSALASILRISGRTPKPFNTRLAHELDSLYNSARPGRERGGLVSTLREKRDLIHRSAFYSRPRG
jgi:hypothetical protein